LNVAGTFDVIDGSVLCLGEADQRVLGYLVIVHSYVLSLDDVIPGWHPVSLGDTIDGCVLLDQYGNLGVDRKESIAEISTKQN